MSHPVDRSSNPSPSEPNPDQPRQGDTLSKVVELFKKLFSSTGPAPTSSNSFSSRVSPLKSPLDELSEWIDSQPDNALKEAREILANLNQMDLNQPFKLILDSKTTITSLPNILQKCTKLFCRNCTSLRALPELPACTMLLCEGCTSLQALPELPACTILDCSNCTSLRALPKVPQTASVEHKNCPNLPQEDRPNYGQLNGY
jgi:hypothetical protein